VTLKYGIIASVGCIILSCILLFLNPYSSEPADYETVLIIVVMLIAPACVGIIASILRVRFLLIVALVWSLPYGLYLSVASIPSLWNLYSVVLILYLISAVKMKTVGRFDR
jgi:hypothetical protein